MTLYEPKTLEEDLVLNNSSINEIFNFVSSMNNDQNDPCSEDYDFEKDKLCHALMYAIRTMLIHTKKLCIELDIPFESLKGE